MVISTLDGIANALGNNSSRFVLNKALITSQIQGSLCSMWRATGQPAQAAAPTVAAVPTKATLGAMDFINQTVPATSYLAWAAVYNSNTGGGMEIHDRVAHLGGLNFNIITSQVTTGLDLSTIGLGVDRRGAADFGDLQWFLEVYAAGGATASNATINVTYNDATTGDLNLLAVGGTVAAGRFIDLIPLIPTASQGKRIRGINSVILSAATGSVGNFGFTCTRQRTGIPFGNSPQPSVLTWKDGFPEVPNDSCLMFVVVCSNVNSGTLRGQGKIVHG